MEDGQRFFLQKKNRHSGVEQGSYQGIMGQFALLLDVLKQNELKW